MSVQLNSVLLKLLWNMLSLITQIVMLNIENIINSSLFT